MRGLIDASDSEILYVLAYVRSQLAPLARSERVETAKAAGMDGDEEEICEFLSCVLQSDEMQDIGKLELGKISVFCA